MSNIHSKKMQLSYANVFIWPEIQIHMPMWTHKAREDISGGKAKELPFTIYKQEWLTPLFFFFFFLRLAVKHVGS